MRTAHPRLVCRALTTALLAGLVVVAPSLVTTPSAAAAGYAGPCTDDLGVTVVVDFQALGAYGGHGGGTVVRCAPGSNGQPFSGTGLDAFQAAGIALTGTSNYGLTFVCRVNGRPMADEPLSVPGNDAYTESCATTPPPTAFWSYWQADNGGSWAFAQQGAKGTQARAGGFEGLSFSLNAGYVPPRTAPSRPAPQPPPTQDPAPSPAPPSPDPGSGSPAPADPSPGESGTPADRGGSGSAADAPGGSAEGVDGSGEQAATDDEATAESPGEQPGSTAGGDLSAVASGWAAAGGTTGTSGPPGDVTTAADATATDEQTAEQPPTDSDLSGEVAGQPYAADPTEDAGGATALWVTFGILLLLGGGAAFAARRRREPALTHEVEP